MMEKKEEKEKLTNRTAVARIRGREKEKGECLFFATKKLNEKTESTQSKEKKINDVCT